jgi:hypothetical protein
MKKITLSKAKAKAWTAFSLYIRTRDSLKTTGTPTDCLCVTCRRKYPTRKVGGIQAGHFVQGRHPGVLFDDRNCHGQCYGCNVMKYGNTLNYYDFMLETYGKEVIDELREKDRQITPMKVFMYQEIEEKYKDLLKELK